VTHHLQNAPAWGRRVAAAIGVAVLLLVAACDGGQQGGSGDPRYVDDAKSLSFVAGSEQEKIIDAVVKPWCTAHELSCTFDLKGSVDQARLLASGSRDYDAYWFASSVFLQVGDAGNVLQDVEPMFLTPIVFAGWQSEMQRLGFAGKASVPIERILDTVESGRTKVWVTNPTQSNSGATVLFGFLNHFAGNGPGQALTQAQLDSKPVDEGITRFIRAMDATPPSSGTLMNDCVARPDDCKTLFTYEDLVIEKNQELVAAGKEPLVATYPEGALAISDAPLGFFPHGAGSDAGKRQALGELRNYLLKDKDAQAKLRGFGRRPVTGVGLSLPDADPAVFNKAWGIQATLNEQPISYPAAPVIKAALDRYQTHYRRPVDVYYCLDGSGSMGENDGWGGVEEAGRQIFRQDQAALNFLQSHPEDHTTVTIFNDDIADGPWTVDGNDPARMRGLSDDVIAYDPGGGTNMYGCLARAGAELSARPADGRKRLVVLMTDGISERVDTEAALAAVRGAGAPVIAIAFGSETDPEQLREIAEATGGSFVQQDDLVSALRQAAGYK
jgi:Ca-activated chloride channel homolog